MSRHAQAHASAAGGARLPGHCVGYPDAEGRTSASVLAYRRSHAVDHAIFYVGAPGVSLSRVHEESRLRNSIEEFLDRASLMERIVPYRACERPATARVPIALAGHLQYQG